MDIQIEITDSHQLEVTACPAQVPGPGELRLRHQAIGVNFIDIYQRTGLYPLPAPAIPGVEGAGIIEALGENCPGLSIGQRVAYAGVAGACASTRLLPASRVVPLPEPVSSPMAAAFLLKGLTAHMLLTRTCRVEAGMTLLVHAAAGGLGSLLTRWATHLGATVIATAGTAEKAVLARAAGARHVITGRDADITGSVRQLTGGEGVDFAIDGIGGAMLARTLTCVRPFGTVASIGQAAGTIPPVDVADLGPRRALTLARPSVMAWSADPRFFPASARAVLAALQEGIIGGTWTSRPLAGAAEAQALLEAGQTTGSLILLP